MSLLNDLLNIEEGAERAYKRNKSNQITRYYRCTSGPKKGKLASDPSKCGTRPDPKKVRHGKRVAKQKGAVRVRKSITTKKQYLSKRISQMNRALRQRRDQNNTKNEFFDMLTRLEFASFLRECTEQQVDILTEFVDKEHNEEIIVETLKQLISE